jgi:hypothetical protein
MPSDSVPRAQQTGSAPTTPPSSGNTPERARASGWDWGLLLFAAALVPAVYQVFHPIGLNMGQGLEMPDIARSLAGHGVFGNPLRYLATGPTATEPPLYPLLLALIVKVCKTPQLVMSVVILGSTLANAFAAALLPRLSQELFGARTPGILAGIISIPAIRLMTTFDANYTALGLILLTLASAALVRNPGRAMLHGAAAGALCGLMFLLNPASILVSGLCVAFFSLRRRAGLPHAARFATAFLVGAALLVSPWFVRNYMVWGKIVSRTNFGMTLYASNNDCAEPSMAMELRNGCYGATHPNMNVPEGRLLLALGEPAYDRRKTAEAMAWIRAHRARFAWLTSRRAIEFWLPLPVVPAYVCYAIWFVTYLSIPGLAWMCWKRERAALLFLAVFLVYPLVYYIVVSDPRYRVPILWMSCLAAGYPALLLPWRWRDYLG